MWMGRFWLISIRTNSKSFGKSWKNRRLKEQYAPVSNAVLGGAKPLSSRPRLPEWLRIKLPTSGGFFETRNLLQDLRLHTVCESAKCPNHWECWSKGTATFMIAGDRCTRACGFCAVSTAKPFPREAHEPERGAAATRRMLIKHVVITAGARDDLAAGGTDQCKRRMGEVRRHTQGSVIGV